MDLDSFTADLLADCIFANPALLDKESNISKSSLRKLSTSGAATSETGSSSCSMENVVLVSRNDSDRNSKQEKKNKPAVDSESTLSLSTLSPKLLSSETAPLSTVHQMSKVDSKSRNRRTTVGIDFNLLKSRDSSYITDDEKRDCLVDPEVLLRLNNKEENQENQKKYWESCSDVIEAVFELRYCIYYILYI